MRECIAKERHAAQNNVCSNNCTDNANKNRGDHAALHEFVLERNTKEFNERGHIPHHHNSHLYLKCSAHPLV